MLVNSCAFTQEEDGYNFDNFKETPLWELAQATRADDANKVQSLLKGKKVNLNYRDPLFKQTLLSLAIENNKRNAFLELLKAGADPNVFLGESNDETALVNAIIIQQNCDMYFIENLLMYGANPNLEIQNPNPEQHFDKSFPLLVAIGSRADNGNECVNIVRHLVDKGAKINVCYTNQVSGICEGVITECLRNNSMELLKYFVIEKKIEIPGVAYTRGGVDGPVIKYSLEEILNTEDFEYNDIKINKHEFDRSDMRKAKKEVLDYLKEMNK